MSAIYPAANPLVDFPPGDLYFWFDKAMRGALIASVVLHLILISLLFDFVFREKSDLKKKESNSIQARFTRQPQETKLPIPVKKTITSVSASALKNGQLPNFSRSEVIQPTKLSIDSDVDDEGIQQYRLTLAKELRRIRKRTSQIQENTWQGDVEAIGIVSATQQIIILLNQSSGNKKIDAAALEMLKEAANVVALPDKLRGKTFSLTLVIRFFSDE